MPGTSLDMPPAQPPAVQAGGPSPMAPVGGMLAGKAQAGADGKGMIVTMYETVKKVLSRMGEMNPEFAPFAARMIAVGDSGLEKLSDKPGGSKSETPPPSSPPPEGSAPGGTGPGGGFPG